jgi:hypothetical protein
MGFPSINAHVCVNSIYQVFLALLSVLFKTNRNNLQHVVINVIATAPKYRNQTRRPSRVVEWASTYQTYHGSWLRCMPHRQESCGTLSSSSHTLTVTQVTSMQHNSHFRDANPFISSMDITSVSV